MKRSTTGHLLSILFTTAICLSLTTSANAGLLDVFESDATNTKKHKPKEQKHKPKKDKKVKSHKKAKKDQKAKPHKNGKKNNHDFTSDLADDAVNGCLGFSSRIIIAGATAAGYMSYERAYLNLIDQEDPLARKYGDPLIPFARVDLGYRYINSNTDAIDYRLEGGFGPFALELSHSLYDETMPDGTEDEMDFMRISGLYRMSFGKHLEIDLGMGNLRIDGNEKSSGFSFSTPVLWHFSEYVGLEFRPAWASVKGANTRDFDIAMLFTWKHASLKTGFRTIKARGTSLDGPYGGVSFRF